MLTPPILIHSPKELALMVVNQREKLKLSQAEVGRRVGLKQQTISEFEIKPESTKLDTLFRILSAVNLDVGVLTKNQTNKIESGWKEEW